MSCRVTILPIFAVMKLVMSKVDVPELSATPTLVMRLPVLEKFVLFSPGALFHVIPPSVQELSEIEYILTVSVLVEGFEAGLILSASFADFGAELTAVRSNLR